MDGKGKEPKARAGFRRDLRRIAKELKELNWLSREYWKGFGIHKEYETRIYVDRDGIRLFQSSTNEANSPSPHGSLFRPFIKITNKIIKLYQKLDLYILVTT